ncbi:MAG: DUF4296 domain-containing protein [Dysgonamonadaceae bacterium]|jgi:hypothetical protein|nr:DUF4296 domain-containing protein [Dysgonamonadaceae bacterium]
MLKQRIFISTLLFVLLLSACGKKVLSEKKMEDVLFDIHLAEATISDNYRDFRNDEKKQELYAGIFKKHGITQEQFDTSLVWYGRNLDKYLIVYDNLTKRYATLAENINTEIELQQKQAALSDLNQVYVWNGTTPVILTSLPGKNMVDFNLNLDTIQLSPKEYYEFAFNVLGIPDSTITPLVTLGIIFPDTVFIERKTITDNGLFTISLPPLDSITNNPTHLFGSIHIPPQKENVKIVIYNINILRKKEQEETN